MNIPDQELSIPQASAVTVKQMELSGEDAHRVAQVLFGDVEFFAYPTLMSDFHQYTKAEIEEKLERWAPYTDPEAIRYLFPEQEPEVWEEYAQTVQKFIHDYTGRKSHAPSNPHKPAVWEYRTFADLYFGDPEEPVGNQNSYRIETWQRVGEIPFRYIVDVTPEEGASRTMILVSPDGGDAPAGIDELLYRNQIWSGEKPTEEQVKAVVNKAAGMLDRIQLGGWRIHQCSIVTAEGTEESTKYAIRIRAFPAVNGIPVLKDPRNYDINSEAEFVFNAEGELYSMRMDMPMEVVDMQPVNRLADIGALLKTAKTGLAEYQTVDHCGKYVVDITSAQSCLFFNPVAISAGVYRYEPALGLYGTIEYEDETGNAYFGTSGLEPRITLSLTSGAILDYRLPMDGQALPVLEE